MLGGGLWRSHDLLLEPLRAHLEPLCLVMPRLEVSVLRDQSVALGAIRVGLGNLEERLYDVDEELPMPPAVWPGALSSKIVALHIVREYEDREFEDRKL